MADAPVALSSEPMSTLNSDYKRCVELSERVAWRVDEVVPRDAALDFSMPFMPRAMFAAGQLPFLSDREKLKLNQIFGNSYRYLFYFVEAYIIAMAMQHAQAELFGDEDNLRAMLRFAEEEVKHQQMFLRFGEMFERRFGSPCHVVESPQEVAEVILRKRPMAVVLATLHLELVTQAHYIDCMKDSNELEPLFQSLFRHHWLEESQHAKLDVLELMKMRAGAPEAAARAAVDDYFDIVTSFEALLGQQAKLDVESLDAAIGRSLPQPERDAVEAMQRKAYHRAFLRDGLTSTLFLEFLAEEFPSALERAARVADRLA
jgi:hypothetical protein